MYPYTSVSFGLLVLDEELDSYRKERCYGQGYGGGGVTGGGYVKSGAHILAKENGNQDVEVDQAKVSSVMLIAVKAACKVGVGRGNAAVGYAKKAKERMVKTVTFASSPINKDKPPQTNKRLRIRVVSFRPFLS